MNYQTMMEDCTNYIRNHTEEKLSPELFGKMYSCKPGYVSYLFSCYYEDSLDQYIKKARVIRGVEEQSRKYPSMRWVNEEKIIVEYRECKEMYVDASFVIHDERSLYRPIDAVADLYRDG